MRFSGAILRKLALQKAWKDAQKAHARALELGDGKQIRETNWELTKAYQEYMDVSGKGKGG